MSRSGQRDGEGPMERRGRRSNRSRWQGDVEGPTERGGSRRDGGQSWQLSFTITGGQGISSDSSQSHIWQGHGDLDDRQDQCQRKMKIELHVERLRWQDEDCRMKLEGVSL